MTLFTFVDNVHWLVPVSPGMDLLPKAPTPKKLLREAMAEPSMHARSLGAYGQVIDTLSEKGYSYAQIANWLSDRLKGEIKRGQVYYVHQNWLEEQQTKQSRAALDQIAKEEASGDGSHEPEKMDEATAQFLQENHENVLDREADTADAQRKGPRRRKKP